MSTAKEIKKGLSLVLVLLTVLHDSLPNNLFTCFNNVFIDMFINIS